MLTTPPLLAPLLAALRFLTVLPIRRGAEFDGLHFQAGLFFFPLIGLGIGGVALMVAALLGWILPPSLTALTGMVVLAAISGCLHLDGLADSADGMLSSRARAEKLVIMRDSRTGAMGVIAIVIILLGKYAALSTAPPAQLGVLLLLMPLAGRCAIVLTMAQLPYARPEGGLGTLFYSPDTRQAALLAAALWLVVVIVVVPLAGLGLPALLATLVVPAGTVLLFAAWCRRSLGGATGDTLGAVCELSELMAAVALTVGS
ncbi:adenosylcobinamide-GDP ribazoletransferase [Desulfoprunum benzoelyticum]|uniref:Adenosylcobinamide-GDP ribazoletransferase n=1 Tax=Desulfoprunum benzoelyticum TaxID=1506996 RepID=A0A840UYD0_9BACT|nr:adenosylcobinamide-GDP ribazoletransferase [Desulfoprunum benzoelyticum]MBB5346459.1 adenosylcobinamide-GDP ribazoletransferase [Desulfoprunum benzoelyticum]MBM9528543.1 adenosylcobinamide-GDP ribazoletransferase [Desulfoprunum benzoelyticum]